MYAGFPHVLGLASSAFLDALKELVDAAARRIIGD
jgi:hypothetical protein